MGGKGVVGVGGLLWLDVGGVCVGELCRMLLWQQGEKKNQLNEDKQEAYELPPTHLKHQEARAPVFREPSAREVCRLAER